MTPVDNPMNTSDKADQPRWEAIPAMLRARVRRYVLWEGLGLTIAWLGVWFWGGLALDYLPVLVGAGEMPAWARSVVLTCLVAGGVVIVYRSILRRVFARIPDTSMALLIERHYPDFAESLVTSVELGPGQRSSTEGVAPLTSQMLATTQQQAAALVPKVDLNRVFNKRPLVQSITLAALFVIATLAFAVTLPASFSLWSQRLFVLSSRTWPRRAAIEVLGFADNRQLKIAEGSDYTLRVRADAQRPTPPPNYCTIYYRTDAGERGRVKMTKKGGTSDGFQYYTYDGKPFKGILSPVQFDVVGFDHRVSDYRLISVASPTVVDVKIDVTPPGYTGLLPRTVAYSPGLRVPAGSQLSVTMASNKDLAQAGVAEVSIADAPPTFITNSVDDASPRSIWLEVVRVTQDLILEVTLVDQDGIRGIRPYRIAIGMIEDTAPNVDIRLKGIGTVVTDKAILPVQGTITDDYQVDRHWLTLDLPDGSTREFELPRKRDGTVQGTLDLRDERSANDNPLVINVGDRVTLSAKATDTCDLHQSVNQGDGDRFELEVVTDSQLLAVLEARELSLRRRFEQVISELHETRDSLSRVQYDKQTDQPDGAEPDDVDATSEFSAAEQADRQLALRQLRVERARQKSERSSLEVLGIAASFDDIRDELVNNRVDAEDRRQRLERDISEPLYHVARQMFPELDTRLNSLRQVVNDPKASTDALASALAQTDDILVELEKILTKMLELETYNELVDLVRSLLKEQEQILDDTKKQRKKQALELLK